MKEDLPYFSHDNNASQHPKMKALIAEYGFEGYGRFWVLNEKIAQTDGAYIDISRKVYRLDLAKDLGFNSDELDGFLRFLSDPEIDLINIKDNKISTDRINELHKKIIEKRKSRRKNNQDNENGKMDGYFDNMNEQNGEMSEHFNREEKRIDKNKLKETKDSCGSNEPPESQPEPKKPPLKDREPENDMERVEKAYGQFWDILYLQKKVATPEPAVSWGKTRRLLKQHFVKIKPEQIIQALKNGMEDSLVMLNAYSLSFMLTDTHLNRLINKPTGAGPPKELAGKESLTGLKSFYKKGG